MVYRRTADDTLGMKFAVVGNPVAYSLSPALHHWVFEELGLKGEYTKLQVTRAQLPQTIERLRVGELNGINVTAPYKVTIVPYLDELSAQAQHIKAANCVVKINGKLTGHDTDSFGFTMLLKRNSIDVTDRPCILLGAGGVARAVLYSLVSNGARVVYLVNRHRDKAVELVSLISSLGKTTTIEAVSPHEIEPWLMGNEVVINCTPVGMNPYIDDTPLPANLIRPGHTLLDIIYTPLRTKFLEMGETVGSKTANGLDMFIYQGLASLDLWFNEPISQQVAIDKIKRYLENQL